LDFVFDFINILGYVKRKKKKEDEC